MGFDKKEIPKPGPTTLRGRWAGALFCGDGKPVVQLQRRLASYGVLHVESEAGAWSWRFERIEKWFGKPGVEAGSGIPTLGAAIEAGVLGAMRLVREACGFRDTHRRAAVDADYAAAHPSKPVPERPDPTARMKERDEAGSKAESTAPRTKRGSKPSTAEPAETKVEVPPLLTLAEAVPDPPEDRKELVRIAEVTKKDADAMAAMTDWERPWRTTNEATATLSRARALIRHASALVRSPLCQGREQEQATDAIQRATTAYEAARKAIAAGRTRDGARAIRLVGEKVALTATRSAKACAKGQTSLPVGPACACQVKVEAPAVEPVAAPVAQPPKGPSKKLASADPAESPADQAAKDKVLLDAFASAIQAAMGGGEA